MRLSTRISKAPPRRSRAAAWSLFGALLLCLWATPGGAVPVVAEARVRAAAGDARGATAQAVEQALVEVVRVIVRRHVNPADLADFAGAVRRSLLDQAHRYVLRYAIADQRWEDPEVVVRVSAEVDGSRVLARLGELGVPAAQLPVKPRVLLMALDPAAASAVAPVARALQEAGYQPRLGPEGPAPSAEQVAATARSAGCHLAVAVAGIAPAEGEAGAGARDSAPVWAQGLWQTGAGGPARASLALSAWLVDPSQRIPAARLEARGEGIGEAPPAADRAAAEAAARRLAYGVLERLEQSGWTLEGIPAVLAVQVTGLTDPLLIEQLAAAWSTVPEVRRVDLVEVARQRATWHLQVVDAGLAWDAVLSTPALSRGRLEWDAFAPGAPQPGADGAAAVFGARWREP